MKLEKALFHNFREALLARQAELLCMLPGSALRLLGSSPLRHFQPASRKLTKVQPM